MVRRQGASIMDHFQDLEDPRIESSKRHQLLDMVAIAICAVIFGADSWVYVEMFGKSKEEWFRSFLDLSNGIPSHDTLGDVFSRLDPEQFQRCFMEWTQAVADLFPADLFPADLFPADLFPADLFPADLFPADLFPADLFPADLFPGEVVAIDRWLLGAAFSLEFLAKHEHVLLVGPASVGKSFLAQALGYSAIRAGPTSTSSMPTTI